MLSKALKEKIVSAYEEVTPNILDKVMAECEKTPQVECDQAVLSVTGHIRTD